MTMSSDDDYDDVKLVSVSHVFLRVRIEVASMA